MGRRVHRRGQRRPARSLHRQRPHVSRRRADRHKPYRQRNQLLRNVGRGQFRLITTEVGGPLLLEQSSRGAAFGDVDNDGDIDILVSVIDDRPLLLRNDSTGGHWITLRLEGVRGNRSAIGAKVVIETGARRQTVEVRSGGSYMSHNDMRAHFGLGAATKVDRLSIRWPNGDSETADSLSGTVSMWRAREGACNEGVAAPLAMSTRARLAGERRGADDPFTLANRDDLVG